MVKRNDNFACLRPSYLFSEIKRKKEAFQKKNPDQQLISLSIGDTTEPLPEVISEALLKKSAALGTPDGYEGYGPEQGNFLLREKISEVLYRNTIEATQIFISDGAKCDLARLQFLFGKRAQVAILNPSYPVYFDSSLILGHDKVHFLPALSSNHFFPHLDPTLSFDLLFFCSPNNPTGYAATKEELTQLVSYVKRKKAILIFDVAYQSYIRDPSLPRSIYEIEGAKEVAIEVGSFSKRVGFSGVRLGWTVIPKELRYDDGSLVSEDWNRLMTTLFNGASIISQAGGLAALTPLGLKKTESLTAYYMTNAKILKEALQEGGYTAFGGENSPYLWVDCGSEDTWALFDEFLEKKGIIVTPGEGFGSFGKGFLRFSSLGKRQDVQEAAKRLKKR